MKQGLWLIVASATIVLISFVLVKLSDTQSKPKVCSFKPIEKRLEISNENGLKARKEREKAQKEEKKQKPKQEKPKQQINNSYISYSVAEEQSYAHELVLSYGWSEEDFNSLVNLWNRESGWNPNVKNGNCYGIPQSCPYTKMGSNYKDWKVQINWGLNYIKNRYGTPTNAWNHFQSTNWY